MELSRQLLKDFAEVTAGDNRRQESQYLRGTIKNVENTKYVKIDGSESLTPLSEVVDVEDGDRVLVLIDNHEATVLGNLTFPPSARKEQEAISKAEDAQTSADDAIEKSETAKSLAQSAGDKADAAIVDATNASASANEAKQSAQEAITSATTAGVKADEAKNLATTAGQNAATAREEAALAQNAATAAQGEVARIQGVVTDVKGDIDTALKEVADQAADLQATKETLEVTYAKKTEVSDVQAALTTEISKKVGELQTTVSQTYAAKNDVVAMEGRLQSQITQTSGEISSVVGKVEQLESDTTEAQKKVDEALEKSAAAQVAAGQAQANATAAQTAADAAKVNADNATKKANEAVQNAANAAATAAEADRKVSAAKTDLEEAKVNLENTMNRVGATEQEIADAQQKVDAAQAAVTQAQKDAAEATAAANNAQNAANKAQTDATEAQNAATNAQKKADNAALAAGNAQASADKAQQDVAALTKRVTSAETSITQNAEQIKLAANKTEEIGTKLDSLQVGGRNLLKDTASDLYNKKINKDTTSNYSRKLYPVDGFNLNNLINKTVVLSFRLKNDGNYEVFDNGNLTYMNDRFGAHMSLIWKNSSTGQTHSINPMTELLYMKENNKRVYAVYTFRQPDSSYDTLYSLSFAIQIGYKPAQDNNSEWFLGEFKLEIGNKATDWSPAPEDQQSQIDGINNNLSNNYYSKTQTDAAIKVAADNVTTTVRKEVTTEITNVNNKVDNLQVGGRNLWIINKSIVTGTKETLPDNHITGQKECWRLENNQALSFLIEPEYSKRMYGKTFTFSAWIKWENVVQGTDSWNTFNIFKHTLKFKNSSSNIESVTYHTTLDGRTGTSDWIKVKYVYTYSSSGYDMLKTNLLFNMEDAKSGTAWVTGIKVEEGNKATDWSPAPEDQQSQIDNIQVGGRNLIINSEKYTKDNPWQRTISRNDDYTITDMYFPVVKNRSYTFQFCTNRPVGLHQVDGTAKGTVHIVLFLQTQDIVGTDNYKRLIDLNNSSLVLKNDKYYQTFTIPTDYEYVRALVRIDGHADGNQYDLRCWNFQAEDGNKDTAWKPPVESMATEGEVQQAQNDANEANGKADATEHRVSVAESTIKQLSDSISMLVTDSNGSSMMTQTSGGWTFNIGSITDAINSATNNIDNLSGSLSQTNNVVNNLNQLANDLSKKTAYINMTTDETGAPCIELGKSGNAFKLRITNTSVDFIEGSSKIAYVSNQALFIEKAIVKNELQIGETTGFVWKTRSNGNLGLRWFG